MQYRPLGRSGVQISALSLGSYVTFAGQVDQGLAKQMMSKAYDAGINFFDNAEAYAEGESERIMGRALRDLGLARDTYMVSSKVMFGSSLASKPTQTGLNRKHVVEACHQALERLGVDYLDLYYCHRPDPRTPIEVTVRAMHDLIVQGKVLYWGTSEWSARQITEAFRLAEKHHLTPPAMEQPHYNLLTRQRFEIEYDHVFRRYGIGATTWGPLRSGVLSGKYSGGQVAEGARLAMPNYKHQREQLESDQGRRTLEVVGELAQLAAELDASPSQLAIAWCLVNRNVSSVILGASRMEQLDENLGALDVESRLEPAVLARIEALLARLPTRRLLKLPGGRRLMATAYAWGLR